LLIYINFYVSIVNTNIKTVYNTEKHAIIIIMKNQSRESISEFTYSEKAAKSKTSISFKLAATALMCALTCAGGFIKISLPLLDITLQTFFACMAGLILGKKWGTASQAIYALMGLIGIPVFARGGGITYIFIPSFGFILGFILCAFLCGVVRDFFYKKRDYKISKINLSDYMIVLLACLIGLLGVYIIGGPYMLIIQSAYLGFNNAALISAALSLPIYFLGDMLSVILLIIATPIILKRVPKLLIF
jgi:biotin transport system substrate-specific component